jgi:hypothetical protein
MLSRKPIGSALDVNILYSPIVLVLFQELLSVKELFVTKLKHTGTQWDK